MTKEQAAHDMDLYGLARPTRPVRASGSLVVHQHLPVDLPPWIRLYENLIAPGLLLLCVAYTTARSVLPGQSVIAFALCGLAVTVPWCWKRVAVVRTRIGEPSLPEHPSAGHPRLICFGTSREIAALELEPRFREPVVFAAWPRKLPIWVLAVPLFVFQFFAGGFGLAHQARWLVITAMSLAWWLGPICLHQRRYYRISPGRFEILRGAPLRSGLIREANVVLLAKSIVCAFDLQKVFIMPADGSLSPPEWVVEMDGLDRPHEFVRAMFEAAVCPELAPELPEDML